MINQGHFNSIGIDQTCFNGKILLLPCDCILNRSIPSDARSNSYRPLYIDCLGHGGKLAVERGQAQ